MRAFIFWSVNLAFLASFRAPLQAQTAAPPTAYIVTEVNSMFGPPLKIRVYRSGNKAMLDNLMNGDKPSHTRTVYDLDAHQSFTWDLLEKSPQCGVGRFSGDWGDPWAMTSEIVKEKTKLTGTETVNGIATNVVEIADKDASAKAWIDPKTSLVVKLQVSEPGQPMKTIIEVTELHLNAPPLATFKLPESCAAALANQPPTPAEHVAAITGSDGKDFADAMHSTASPNSCTVAIRVVHAVSMQPIPSGFQIALDTTFDPQNPPHYVTGLSDTLNSTFEGGGVHEVTSQLRNGVLRIPNAPAAFHIELAFGKPGSVNAEVYRACVAPQTVLLLILKNPAKISDGADWVWVKSGKYATLP